MDAAELELLKYPVGKFQYDPAAPINPAIGVILNFPVKLREETGQLSVAQLDTPYRPDGWTIRQVVHHCADSHMNAFIRFKLALSEEQPTIKAYKENLWAQQHDYTEPIQPSLLIVEGLHHRWAALLNGMTDVDFQKTYVHPQYNKTYSLHEALGAYAWHCEHHLAHITSLKKRKGW